MKVLIVESEFLHQDTWVGNAVERLADALSQQNVTVIKSTSFDDGFAILSSNEAIDCLMFSYQMEHPDEHQNVRQLIGKLHERQQNVPVFLLGDREKALAAMDRDLLELVDEFAWILEDTADFIAGRAVAAMTRYRQQLLPPLFSALMKYSDIHEYSWAAPGHQGGVGFTKTPAGRFYHDYYGENLFRTDMGIERTSLGSLLDHTGAFGESEKYAARVFGADRSWSVVVGTSGSNRTIMQACMTDNDVVVVDRNCHKSIEQGLMLTGAKPVYMVPAETESEKERTRALLFTVLSRFLDSKKFLSLMMYMLRNCVSDSVYQIIESDIHKDWNLSMVASCLCLSPSLLKKKLKSENTSYSQIITTCRMRYAVNELMMDGKNISQVSQSCGYNSTSYFISVFKDFYGMTPLHYVSQHRERTVA
ncbi:AraC family transcriptional regulator [Escherichia coli]|nr:AraC family transcriptional regulator [Escherichia coli]